MQYIAGLDIGGTTGRMKINHLAGEELGEFFGPGCSINTDGYEKSESRYRELVMPVLAEQGLKPGDCLAICIAASGVDTPELENACRKAFLGMGFTEKALLVKNDCEIFLNLSTGPSLVLVAGTGSICYGRDAGQKVVRTGGWGHILSDEGSAFRLGLDIARHIGEHLDGRQSCPVLYQAFYQQTGIDQLSELDKYINTNLMNKAVIGALAPLAEQSYHAGEAAGINVITEGAKVLAALVTDTCHKMELAKDEAASLWLWGSVLVKNELLREQVKAQIAESYHGLTADIPKSRALDIALQAANNLYQQNVS